MFSVNKALNEINVEIAVHRQNGDILQNDELMIKN